MGFHMRMEAELASETQCVYCVIDDERSPKKVC